MCQGRAIIDGSLAKLNKEMRLHQRSCKNQPLFGYGKGHEERGKHFPIEERSFLDDVLVNAFADSHLDPVKAAVKGFAGLMVLLCVFG